MDNVGTLFLSILDRACRTHCAYGPGGYVLSLSGHSVSGDMALDVRDRFYVVLSCLFYNTFADGNTAGCPGIWACVFVDADTRMQYCRDTVMDSVYDRPACESRGQ